MWRSESVVNAKNIHYKWHTTPGIRKSLRTKSFNFGTHRSQKVVANSIRLNTHLRIHVYPSCVYLCSVVLRLCGYAHTLQNNVQLPGSKCKIYFQERNHSVLYLFFKYFVRQMRKQNIIIIIIKAQPTITDSFSNNKVTTT